MMKRYLFLFIATIALATACGNETDSASGQEEALPPPVRPDQEISEIDQYIDSLMTDNSLEFVERRNDEEPGVSLLRKGHFGGGDNYYISEQTITTFTHQVSTFAFRAGTLVYSKHQMMRKRCGGPDEICLSEARQYYQAQELIWSESRNRKYNVEGRSDLLELEAFQLLDTVKYEVIPNLRESTKLYDNEVILGRALLEELRQPLSTDEKMLKLE